MSCRVFLSFDGSPGARALDRSSFYYTYLYARTLTHTLFLFSSVLFQTTPRGRLSGRLVSGERPTIARAPFLRDRAQRRAYNVCRLDVAQRAQRRKQFRGTKTTLSQAWSGNCIRGPQCAFEMSMFMCPAVHKLTRN